MRPGTFPRSGPGDDAGDRLPYRALLVPSDPSAISASHASADSARKLADEAVAIQALRESETRLRGVIEAGLDAVIIAGAHRRADGTIERFDVLDANARASHVVQLPREALIGHSLMELVADRPDSQLWEQCCAVIITGQPLEVTLRFPTADAPVRWLQRRLSRVHTDTVAITWCDITSRELERGALAASEARHHDLFEGNSAVQLLADPETAHIIDANPAALSFYGWPRDTLRAMYLTDLEAVSLEAVSLEAWRDAVSPLAPGAGLRLSRTHRVASGALRQVDVCVGMVAIADRRVVHLIIQDTTDRVPAQLVRSIAHDFNNLFTVIRGSTGFLREGISPASPDAEDLAAIERATERAVELTKRLLDVSRR